MVDFDAEGRVRLLIENLTKAICAIVGALRFGRPPYRFIHQYLTVIEAGLLRSDAGNNPLQRREIPIGDVIQAAINSGLRVEAEILLMVLTWTLEHQKI